MVHLEAALSSLPNPFDHRAVGAFFASAQDDWANSVLGHADVMQRGMVNLINGHGFIGYDNSPILRKIQEKEAYRVWRTDALLMERIGRWCGDVNPIHLDGRSEGNIVYGVLDDLMVSSMMGEFPRGTQVSIGVSYTQAIKVGESIQASIHLQEKESDEGRLVFKGEVLNQAGQSAASYDIEVLKERVGVPVFPRVAVPHSYEKMVEPRIIRPEEIRKGSGDWIVEAMPQRAQIEGVSEGYVSESSGKIFGGVDVRLPFLTGALTYYAGMESPGQGTIYVGRKLRFWPGNVSGNRGIFLFGVEGNRAEQGSRGVKHWIDIAGSSYNPLYPQSRSAEFSMSLLRRGS